MLRSLRFRLMLTMTLMLLVVVGTIVILATRSTADGFRRYLASDVQRDEQVVASFQASYAKNPSKANLETLVKQLSQTSGERFIVLSSTDVVQADSAGTLIGQTLHWPEPPHPPGLGGNSEVIEPITATTATQGFLEQAPEYRFIPIAVIQDSTILPASSSRGGRGNSPGSSFGNSGPGAQGRMTVVLLRSVAGNVNERTFLDSVNTQLLLGAATAGLVAVLLIWLLSRRILGPLEALTTAAGRMAQGDLHQRVEVKSKDEIGNLATAFNSMSEGVSRLEQARRNMVADVAHELRTPIANIMGYLELMVDGTLKPERNILESLHGEAVLLSRLVEDLQDLELMDAGKLKLARLRIDPEEVIEKAVTATQPLAAEKEVDLKIQMPADLPAIEADPDRLGQVLRNLLNNAVTHTPAGGHVNIEACRRSGEIEVRVSDTGPGIAAEHLPHIFERFYRADQSRRRSTGGAGLGLAIVKELVEMQGGHVRAESPPGQGASFYVTLPLPA